MNPIQNYTKTLQDRDEWSQLSKNVGASERALSIGLGVGLLALGAISRTPVALVGAGLGVALVFRGVTGACAIYHAAGMSTATRAHKDHGLRSAPSADEARLDDMLDDSFPASDPPSFTPTRAQPTGT